MKLDTYLLEYEKYVQVNSNDVITLKVLHRHFKDVMYRELSGKKNEPYLKDKLMTWAKDTAKNNEKFNYKKAIEYINTIYGNTAKMSYSEFTKKLSSIEVPSGNPFITDPDEQSYQTAQRIEPTGERNKTTTVLKNFSVLEKILDKYKNEFPDEVNKIENIASSGHFTNALGFIRFTVVDKNWVHIDAIQTDFFNKVKKLAAELAEQGNKEAKKMFSEILGLENEVYKTALSHTKFKNPSAKIWTMNTPEIVKDVEHVGSNDKADALYNTLPPKMGFKKISIEQLKKVLSTRSINEPKKGLLSKFFNDGEVDRNIFRVNTSLSSAEVKENIFKDFKKRIKNNGKDRGLGEIQKDFHFAITNNITINDDTPHQVFEHITNICHQLALLAYDMDKKELRDSSTLNQTTVNAVIDGLIKQKETDEHNTDKPKYPNVWWANRDMINESNVIFSKLLTENLKR